MLTKKEFEDLWERFFLKITSVSMPYYSDYEKLFKCYEEYLKQFSEIPVRYVLIAEAAPKNGDYVYNCSFPSGLNTPYFKEVIKAFDINFESMLDEANVKKAFSNLAAKGVLILDLFPFAISYTTLLRKKLIKSGVVKEFWDGSVYSIKKQIQDLCKKYKIELHHDWDLCVIAPPTIGKAIVAKYSALVVTPCISGIHNNTTFHALHPHPLRNSDWKKVAASKSGFPNATLIKIAFDL